MKSTATAILLVGTVALLTWKNPTIEDYEEFFEHEFPNEAVNRDLAAQSVPMLVQNTIRHDFIVFSFYETPPLASLPGITELMLGVFAPAPHKKTTTYAIGVLKNFIAFNGGRIKKFYFEATNGFRSAAIEHRLMQVEKWPQSARRIFLAGCESAAKGPANQSASGEERISVVNAINDFCECSLHLFERKWDYSYYEFRWEFDSANMNKEINDLADSKEVADSCLKIDGVRHD